MDDENNPNRRYGDKTILQVPENHGKQHFTLKARLTYLTVAGGFRIGKRDSEDKDQEFVLFSQGRHVLPDSKVLYTCKSVTDVI